MVDNWLLNMGSEWTICILDDSMHLDSSDTALLEMPAWEGGIHPVLCCICVCLGKFLVNVNTNCLVISLGWNWEGIFPKTLLSVSDSIDRYVFGC